MPKKIVFIALLITVGLLFGCGKKEDDVIKIGMSGPLTGPDGHMGETIIDGSKLAIDEWNARGGLLGKKIVSIIRDDEAKPEKATTVAQDLANNGVIAVLGPLNSGCTLPASVIYDRNHIVEITVSSNTQVTERGLGKIFRICWRDDQQGEMDARFMREKLKLSKIAILHNKSAYGEGLATDVKKFFTTAGGEVVMYQGMAEEELDFRTEISLIKSSGAEGIFFGGFYDQSGPLIVQLRQAGVNLPLVGGDSNMDQNFINTAGNYATDVYFSGAIDYKKLPAAASFLKNYAQKYGQEGPYSIYGYASANVLFEAIQSAGTTDANKVADLMRHKTFNTAFGPIEYDGKGDIKNAHLGMWTVKDGAFISQQ
jgi:branched-chain amino acid transport system substrate-binding protein